MLTARLRDHSAAALQDEDRWLANTKQSLEGISADSLSSAQRINRDVALAQVNFLLHQHQERRYQERALDTYTDEPFRAVDWQLQGMTQTGDKTYGTAEEWGLVNQTRRYHSCLSQSRSRSTDRRYCRKEHA